LILLISVELYRLRRLELPRFSPFIYALAALHALLFVFLATRAFPPQPRVQWDESELLRTSYAMAFQHSATAPSMIVPGPQGPLPVAFDIGRRPMLFSFLVSLAHVALGPSDQNPLRVNLLVLWVLLFFFFLRGYRAGGWLLALSVPLLAASVPLLFWVGTSGGMDLLSLLLLSVLACAVYDFVQCPQPELIPRLVLFTALAGYTRYESIGAAGILLLTALAHGWRAGISRTKLLWPLAALPCLLFPLMFQLAGPSFEFRVPDAAPVFSWRNLPGNALTLLRVFFSWRIGPYHGPLSLLGMAALAVACIRGNRKSLAAIIAPALGCSVLVVLCFFDADPVRLQSVRLYLPVALAVALSALLLPSFFPRYIPRSAMLAVALLAFGGMWFSTVGAPLMPDGPAVAAIHRITEFADRLPASALLVFDPSGYFVNRGKNVVSSEVFWQDRARWRALHAKGALSGIVWIRLGNEFADPKLEAARKKLQSIAGPEFAGFPPPTEIREIPF
jgi:hypothetical protein